MRVVALHRPARVSGVSVAGLRAAMLKPPHHAWRPMVVGEELSDGDVRRSALAGAPDLCTVSWPAGSDPVAQVLAVGRALDRLGAQVVVPNDLPHGFVAAALRRHRGVRCAAWMHSASHEGELLVTHCLELADSWRGVSTGVRDHVIATGAEAALTLDDSPGPAPAFVDIPLRPAPLPPPPLRLLYAGRLEKHHKRVLDLATLCDELLSAGVSYRMVIAGEGPAEQELRTAITPHLEAGRVQLVQPVAPGEIRRLIEQSHVGLLVSGSEGAPTIVMESLAAGRPAAITTGCGDAAAWVRDGLEGVVVATGDMRSMALRLAAIAQSPATLAGMARAAHARARTDLSEDARAPALDSLVEEARAKPAGLTSAPSVIAHWERILHAVSAIGPAPPDSVADLARGWLADLGAQAHGLTLDSLPRGVPPRDTPAERRLRRALQSLRADGARRVALYAAGRHTRKVARVIEQSSDIVAIIDDRAGEPSGPPPVLSQRPVLRPDDFRSLGADALIISSDEHERELLARAKQFAPNVIPLYDAA